MLLLPRAGRAEGWGERGGRTLLPGAGDRLNGQKVQLEVQVQVQVLLITSSPSESLKEAWWYISSFLMVLSTPPIVAVFFLADPFSFPGLEEREKGTRGGLAEPSKL